MKDLLEKLIKMDVDIYFKSKDKICNVVIEAIIGNSIVASQDEKIKTIEIPHIAYVIIKEEYGRALEVLLNSEKNNDKDKKDGKDDKDDKDCKDGKDDKYCKCKKDNEDNEKCKSQHHKEFFEY